MHSNKIKTKVLYIIGRGRSGSTILSHHLEDNLGYFNAGELKNWLEYNTRPDKMYGSCLDGKPFKDHPFWNNVRLGLKKKLGTENPDLKTSDEFNFQANNSAMFNTLAEESGSRIIIDASKKFDRLRRLLSFMNRQLYVIFIVRDPRAYVYSCERRTPGSIKYFLGIPIKIFDWNIKNLITRIFLLFKARHVLVLRYEDYISSPGETFNRISQFVTGGTTIDSENVIRPRKVSFSGNFRVFNEIRELRFDDSYIDDTSSWRWGLLTLCSIPSIFIFRYSLLKGQFRNLRENYSG